MFSPGDGVHHYRILGPLGKGGMGEVFLAQDTILDRKVALKFLRDFVEQDPRAAKRFLREAKAAAALDHPFICKIYETGEVDGHAYIAMEHVAGDTLASRLARAPLPFREALRTALEVAEALEDAHAKGFVHRDLKPANIMLAAQGHAKVMDFGLAVQSVVPEGGDLESETLSRLTRQGVIVGTPAYMSPEQAAGKAVDARSDVFSLGVMLHEMVTGVNPFLRPSALETISAILRDPPPTVRLKEHVAALGLQRILRRALGKSPDDRYATIHELATDLRALEERTFGRAWRPRAIAVAATAVALVLALGGGAVWLAGRRGTTAGPDRPPLSILIADFNNDTGDPLFEGTLESAFGLAMEGAAFVTVFDRGEARRTAAQLKPGATRVDDDLALLVAKREGIGAVLTGTATAGEGGYRLEARLLDPSDGHVLARGRKDVAAKPDVLPAVARIAAELRGRLGDRTPESAQVAAAETFSASSLQAAHYYALAQEAQWNGDSDEAVREYSRALELDPELGRAYAGLAVIHANRLQRPEAEKYYALAFSKIDRMSEREKLRTRGGYYLMVRNYPRAIEEFEALVDKYPADTGGLYNLALAHFYSRDMAAALEGARRAIARYPRNTFYKANASLFAMYAGDFADAVWRAKAVLEENSSYLEPAVALALSELAMGHPDRAAEEYRRLATVGAQSASVAAVGLADLAVYEGRLADAEESLTEGIQADQHDKDVGAAAHKLAMLGQVRLLRGNESGALQASARAEGGTRLVSDRFEAARIYLAAGRPSKARTLASELASRLEPDPRAYALLVEGEIDLLDGSPREAARHFQEAAAIADTWLGRFDLGRALLDAGAFAEAHAEFEHCLTRRGEATAVFLDDRPSYRYVPPVYYYLARAQEGLGSPAATRSYEAFLAVKKTEEDPLVREARRRLASR
jgi:tetratricopeptide (TPR) repeat protein